MARLVVKVHGSELESLELQSGQEYTVGRSKDCNLVLTEEKGISRKHLKLYESEEGWVAELTSRFGSLLVEGEQVEFVTLKDESVFVAPPYEFYFEDSADHEKEDEQETSEETPDSPAQPESPSQTANLEATFIGQTPLIPFLKLMNLDSGRDQILKLEGNIWVCGRDASCEVVIDDSHVSRRHFEIIAGASGYLIKDLGSANGTCLNNKPLPIDEAVPIQSGDSIKIISAEIQFELHDVSFQNKLAVINQTPLAPAGPVQTQMQAYQIPHNLLPNVIKETSDSDLTVSPKTPIGRIAQAVKTNRRVQILLSIIVILLAFVLSDSSEKKDQGTKEMASEGNIFEKLTPEQKAAVKDSFSLAESLYTKGKYELCLAEIQKLHELVPFYENSKEIAAYCQQGSALLQEKRHRERLERERQENEQKIIAVTDRCRQKMSDSITLQEMTDCLGPAMEIDPQHPNIVEILALIEDRDLEQQRQRQAAAERRKLVQKGLAMYNRAKALYEEGQLRNAISRYNRYLSSTYPDPHNKKSVARKELNDASERLTTKVNQLLEKCQMEYGKKNYKEAVRLCDEALSEDPGHKEVLTVKQQALSDLRKNMKALYEDSVLEESLGNIEAAKTKWKEIKKENLETDEYYKKADRKLKQYGVGI